MERLIGTKNHETPNGPKYGSLKAARLPGRENMTYTYNKASIRRSIPNEHFLF